VVVAVILIKGNLRVVVHMEGSLRVVVIIVAANPRVAVHMVGSLRVVVHMVAGNPRVAVHMEGSLLVVVLMVAANPRVAVHMVGSLRVVVAKRRVEVGSLRVVVHMVGSRRPGRNKAAGIPVPNVLAVKRLQVALNQIAVEDPRMRHEGQRLEAQVPPHLYM
jgi:hypothetical protein